MSDKVETVMIVSRLLGEQAQMLKDVVGEYEQCGVALGQACEEIEARDRTLRAVERGARRALAARSLRESRAILNDLLLTSRQR